jgi:hypothetical protein
MGLDIYVGSLTRYYAGDWETVVQQYGRQAGIPVKVVRVNEPEDAVSDPEIIRSAVIQWRQKTSNGIKAALRTPLDWNEAADSPFFTDKPGWDSYSALLIWAAHEEQPQFAKPKENNEDWASNLAFQASNANGFKSRYSHLLKNVELWLPCNIEFTFEAPDVAGKEVRIGSSLMLFNQLRELNARSWNTDEGTMGEWLREDVEHLTPLDIDARSAFAMFMELCKASIEHRLPMKLDY